MASYRRVQCIVGKWVEIKKKNTHWLFRWEVLVSDEKKHKRKTPERERSQKEKGKQQKKEGVKNRWFENTFCWYFKMSLSSFFFHIVKGFQVLLCNSSNLTSVICLHIVKWFQVLLCNSNHITVICLHTFKWIYIYIYIYMIWKRIVCR